MSIHEQTDRVFLLRNLDGFRSEVLGDLSTDELLEILTDPFHFGLTVRERFREWRISTEADMAINYEEKFSE